MVTLDWQQVEALKKQGYTDTQIQQAIADYEREEAKMLTASQASATEVSSMSGSNFAGPPVDDLARWQLELNDILERAEHMLRGDLIKTEQNRTYWIRNPEPGDNPLNDKGVRLLMKILANYVNRNTILSDYTGQEIKMKVHLFSQEVNDLLFMKYDEIGMDSENKRKEYPMIVMMLKDIVHNAYSRSKLGGERESLRKSMSIQESYQSQGQPVRQHGSGFGGSRY